MHIVLIVFGSLYKHEFIEAVTQRNPHAHCTQDVCLFGVVDVVLGCCLSSLQAASRKVV